MSDTITSVNAVVSGRVAGGQRRILIVTFGTSSPAASANFDTALQDLQVALASWANRYDITLNFDGPKND